MKTLITDLQHSISQAPEHRHAHLSCEIIYVLKGRARFTINGADYTVGPGNLVFISSLEEHQVRVLSEPFDRYFAVLSLEQIRRSFGASPLAAVFFNRPRGFLHCVSLRAYRAEADAIFASLHREFRSDLPCARELAEAELLRLLIFVKRVCPQNFALLPEQTAARVMAAQRYIEQHFREEISVADVAQRLHISASHLAHSFHDQAGCSPKQYIKLLRLAYARELMETSDIPVSEAAKQCGYTDVNNFIRAFRQNYAVPPGKWRKSI